MEQSKITAETTVEMPDKFSEVWTMLHRIQDIIFAFVARVSICHYRMNQQKLQAWRASIIKISLHGNCLCKLQKYFTLKWQRFRVLLVKARHIRYIFGNTNHIFLGSRFFLNYVNGQAAKVAAIKRAILFSILSQISILAFQWITGNKLHSFVTL
jgi:hypothetical protein